MKALNGQGLLLFGKPRSRMSIERFQIIITRYSRIGTHRVSFDMLRYTGFLLNRRPCNGLHPWRSAFNLNYLRKLIKKFQALALQKPLQINNSDIIMRFNRTIWFLWKPSFSTKKPYHTLWFMIQKGFYHTDNTTYTALVYQN